MTELWLFWALLSALFAAATAIFAKLGVAGVDSNFATAVRTTVVVLLAWAIALGDTFGRQFPCAFAAHLVVSDAFRDWRRDFLGFVIFRLCNWDQPRALRPSISSAWRWLLVSRRCSWARSLTFGKGAGWFVDCGWRDCDRVGPLRRLARAAVV